MPLAPPRAHRVPPTEGAQCAPGGSVHNCQQTGHSGVILGSFLSLWGHPGSFGVILGRKKGRKIFQYRAEPPGPGPGRMALVTPGDLWAHAGLAVGRHGRTVHTHQRHRAPANSPAQFSRMVQTAGQGDSCTTPSSARNPSASWPPLTQVVLSQSRVEGTGLAPGRRVGNEATFPKFMISWRQPLKKSTSSGESSGHRNNVSMHAWAPTGREDPRPNGPA